MALASRDRVGYVLGMNETALSHHRVRAGGWGHNLVVPPGPSPALLVVSGDTKESARDVSTIPSMSGGT
jgi:hypothetical protein